MLQAVENTPTILESLLNISIQCVPVTLTYKTDPGWPASLSEDCMKVPIADQDIPSAS